TQWIVEKVDALSKQQVSVDLRRACQEGQGRGQRLTRLPARYGDLGAGRVQCGGVAADHAQRLAPVSELMLRGRRWLEHRIGDFELGGAYQLTRWRCRYRGVGRRRWLRRGRHLRHGGQRRQEKHEWNQTGQQS